MRYGHGLTWIGALSLSAICAIGCGDDGTPTEGTGGDSTTSDPSGDDLTDPSGDETSPTTTPTTTFATSTATNTDTDTGDETSGSTGEDTEDQTTGETAGCDGLGMQGLLLWTTLDDESSVTAPMTGAGAGEVSTMPANDFVSALDGQGVMLDAAGEYIRFPQQSGGTDNIDLDQGTIDFCYRPNYDHLDSLNHGIFGTGDIGGAGGLRIRKAAGNNNNALQVIANGGSFNELNIPSNAYAFVPDTWVRITVSWDFGVGMNEQNTHVYIDGVEVIDPNAPTGPVAVPGPDPAGFVYVGAVDDGDPPWSSDATIDDFKLYDSARVP